MEATYSKDIFPCVSEVIKLKAYFDEYTSVLTGTLYREAEELSRKSEFAAIAHIMAKSESRVTMISERCRLSLLDPDEENPLDISITNDEEPDTFRNHTGTKKLLEKATAHLATAVYQNNEHLKHQMYQIRLRQIRKASLHDFIIEKNPLPALARKPEGFLVMARIYKPFLCNSDQQLISQNCLLYSTDKLSDLRDKIYCQNDDIDITNNQRHELHPSGMPPTPMNSFITSGLFFFGNTFYCDFRDSANKDYGEVIDKWVSENPQTNLGPFHRKSMSDTKIEDLEIRLGFPYMFMHMGSCEHLIIFIDARLINTEDPTARKIYPIVDKVPRYPLYCSGCDMYLCKWIVEDDERIPQTPAPFCDTCFRGFCFKDGQKIGSFTSYPYSQPEINVEDFSESCLRKTI